MHPTVPDIVPVTLPSIGTFHTIASILKLSDVRAESGSDEELFEKYKLPTSMDEVSRRSLVTASASASVAEPAPAAATSAHHTKAPLAEASISRFSWNADANALSVTDSSRQAPAIVVDVRQAKSGALTSGRMLEILAAIGTSDFPGGANLAEQWSKYNKSSKKDVLVACLAQRLDTIVSLLAN